MCLSFYQPLVSPVISPGIPEHVRLLVPKEFRRSSFLQTPVRQIEMDPFLPRHSRRCRGRKGSHVLSCCLLRATCKHASAVLYRVEQQQFSLHAITLEILEETTCFIIPPCSFYPGVACWLGLVGICAAFWIDAEMTARGGSWRWTNIPNQEKWVWFSLSFRVRSCFPTRISGFVWSSSPICRCPHVGRGKPGEGSG